MIRYRYEVRIGPEDVGKRVVVRWRRPAGDGEEVTDALGFLESADETTFVVRNRRGEQIVIPTNRALAAKVIPFR